MVSLADSPLLRDLFLLPEARAFLFGVLEQSAVFPFEADVFLPHSDVFFIGDKLVDVDIIVLTGDPIGLTSGTTKNIHTYILV